MKILIVSNIELSETNAAGNTFANWLTGWPDAEISSIYCREAMPSNNFCDSFFRISPTGILKNILMPWKIGEFLRKSEIKKGQSTNFETKLIRNTKTKTKYRTFLYLLQDFIISTRIWQNRKYRNYIKSFDPDIVFSFAKSEAFLYQNFKYIKKHTHAQIVLFFADDMYNSYQRKGLRNRIYLRRFPKIVKLSDKNYGASVLMCEEYSKLFDIQITTLYKGCAISASKSNVNCPVRIVYAGNLYYGREKTLSAIAQALRKINLQKQIARLEIYTNAVISDEISTSLNIEGTSKIMGARPFQEIKAILNEADIVLHVESFDAKNIEYVRLSYSTKISDCLQSGSMMLVVGPDGIASVEEAKLIDGVVVVSNIHNIQNILQDILNKPEVIINNAEKTNMVAKKVYPIESVRKRLYNDFLNLIK